ncbi:hypothetical protein [Candidatus Poriferisocius sp.]|uniref:hypothetical protein n=1 Tax=Candidatus Poriferisocius sp. TaxID=3101276 RepID=UPI003B51746F
MHPRGRVCLLVPELGPVNSCLAHENHLLAGQNREDPFGDWGPDPAHPGREGAGWACPKKTPEAGREAAEWACPSGKAEDWSGGWKRRAGPRAPRQRVSRQRVLVLAGEVFGGLRARKALTMAQPGEAEAVSLHWR